MNKVIIMFFKKPKELKIKFILYIFICSNRIYESFDYNCYIFYNNNNKIKKEEKKIKNVRMIPLLIMT